MDSQNNSKFYNNINNNLNENNIIDTQIKENSIPKNNNNINNLNYNQRYNESFDDLIFHKKKKDYNIFTINPDVEEIPTFTFENDRNLNSYKGKINIQNNYIEQNSKNYLEYMKKFENKRKTPFSSPYLVYQEKTKGNNIYYNRNTRNNNNNFYNELEYNDNMKEKKNKTMDINTHSMREKSTPQIISNNYNYNLNNNEGNNGNNILQNINNNYNNNNNYGNILSNSTNLEFSGRGGEITNPNYFFHRFNKDYYKYRLEQKKYLDYNYEVIKNRLNNKKREPDINPYNPINNQVFENGKTDLAHNPILNPINNYSYNKYLEKEVNLGNRYKNMNNIQNCSNFSKRSFSTLLNAGSHLLNNN